MNDIKIVASDLDGTLLNGDREVSDYSLAVITKLHSLGVEFVPCTARPYSEMPQALKLNKSIRYMVCSNGASIYDNQKEEVIVRQILTADLVLSLLEKVEKINPFWSLIIGDDIYSSSAILANLVLLKIDEGYNEFLISTRKITEDYHAILKSNTLVSKIHFVIYDKDNKQELLEALSSFEGIYITASSVNNIEILNPEASKGKALYWIMNEINCNPSQAIAFGDNTNDISLLEAVEHRCVVANGTDDLKQIAKYIVKSNHEEGVAQFLNEQFCLGV